MTSAARDERRWTVTTHRDACTAAFTGEGCDCPAEVWMPVAAHEAALAAARQVDAKRIGEAVRREFPLTGFPASLEHAILAALTPEPEKLSSGTKPWPEIREAKRLADEGER